MRLHVLLEDAEAARIGALRAPRVNQRDMGFLVELHREHLHELLEILGGRLAPDDEAAEALVRIEVEPTASGDRSPDGRRKERLEIRGGLHEGDSKLVAPEVKRM